MTHLTPTQKSREDAISPFGRLLDAIATWKAITGSDVNSINARSEARAKAQHMYDAAIQSAHQSGAEAKEAEAVQALRDLQQTVECSNDGLLDRYTLDSAIERIQGSK